MLPDSGPPRLLLIDDNEGLHQDYRKILLGGTSAVAEGDDSFASAEAALFGDVSPVRHQLDIDSAYQGQEALAMVKRAAAENRPYSMAFVDMRMPPGWDGVETVEHLWQVDPQLQIVLCTAYTDYSWEEISERIDLGDRLLILKKPFENMEIRQMVSALTTKWQMTRQAALKMSDLALAVAERTKELSQRTEALRDSERRYRRLFETATDGILLLDFETGAVTDVNAALVAMLGYTRGDLLGRKFWELAPFRNVPAERTSLTALRHRNPPGAVHWPLETQSGLPLDVELVSTFDCADGVKVIQYNLRDITARTRAEARIHHMALHDALTGLPNRILLEDRLGQAVARARRSGKGVAVLVLDLDRFKDVNDSLGHHVGDQLLVETARRLRTCLRQDDTAARLGGDEFVICLPEVADGPDAAIVADRLLRALAETVLIDEHQLHIGGSVGISLYPADGQDPHELLRTADTAMYDAKASGRGTFRFFTPALNEAAQRRHNLATDVRQACTRGEFVLYYQPQNSLESGAIVGVEALLRWQHPQHGLISPVQFIPLLEELGLIIEVGRWVLRTACRQNARWQADGLPPIRMAVNVSAQQFCRGDIASTVEQALAESGLSPEWLELELTESEALDDTEASIQVTKDLKRLGISLALDDFGTGWSSMSCLMRFPLDRIKIDRSFMRNVVSDTGASALVFSIMNLAKTLGLDCIAEGVETVEQLDYLRQDQQMCAAMQGFLFSQAVPAPELEALLRSDRRLP
jgi:diguanylate cyclase (GGDEF)-like protein/PAS domain S-box-containing protein